MRKLRHRSEQPTPPAIPFTLILLSSLNHPLPLPLLLLNLSLSLSLSLSLAPSPLSTSYVPLRLPYYVSMKYCSQLSSEDVNKYWQMLPLHEEWPKVPSPFSFSSATHFRLLLLIYYLIWI
jgi:hypothetical protein